MPRDRRSLTAMSTASGFRFWCFVRSWRIDNSSSSVTKVTVGTFESGRGSVSDERSLVVELYDRSLENEDVLGSLTVSITRTPVGGIGEERSSACSAIQLRRLTYGYLLKIFVADKTCRLPSERFCGENHKGKVSSPSTIRMSLELFSRYELKNLRSVIITPFQALNERFTLTHTQEPKTDLSSFVSRDGHSPILKRSGATDVRNVETPSHVQADEAKVRPTQTCQDTRE